MLKQRDVRKNHWLRNEGVEAERNKLKALIPSAEGRKRFTVSGSDFLEQGDPALAEVREFIASLGEYSRLRTPIEIKVWQAEDLSFNEQQFSVQWFPYSNLFLPKKRNGALKWNKARQYSRQPKAVRIVNQIDAFSKLGLGYVGVKGMKYGQKP